ncbi:MAG: hypothetical protein E7535_09235 [Ruminococcaceae bacterium]|nr:hypothetical protein [Oscillospiraceae bacterium]
MKKFMSFFIIATLFILSSCNLTAYQPETDTTLPRNTASAEEATTQNTEYFYEQTTDIVTTSVDIPVISETTTAPLPVNITEQNTLYEDIPEETKDYMGGPYNFTKENINSFKDGIAYGHQFTDITFVAADYLLSCSELIEKYGQNYTVYFSHGTSTNDQFYFVKGGDGWVHFIIAENGTEDHYTVNCKKEYLSPWEVTNYRLVEECPCQGDNYD